MARSKTTAAVKAHRADGWVNLLTNLGSKLKDKRQSAWFCLDRLTWQEQRDLWRGNDIAARIVESYPDEMVREWFELKVEGDKRTAEDTMAVLDGDELQAREKVHRALCYERAYGGGAILLGANDGQKDLTKPLNLAAIKSLDFLNVLQPREMYATRYYSDALSPKFGEPELYRIQPLVIDANTSRLGSYPVVHESRLIRFPGVEVDNIQLRENLGWGDSVLNRCNQVMRNFDLSWDSAAYLLQDFAQAVIKMAGLNDLIADNDDDVIVQRAQMMELTRSVARALLLDKDDDFERKPTPITGLPEMLDRFCNRLAAAAKMPVTVLMGQAPAGLNATGASDIRAWYDQISALQERKLTPRLNYLLKVLFAAKNGPTKGREPKNWSIQHNPLWQLDETQKADVRLKQAQADVAYINAQVLMPEEVAVSRFGGDEYSTDTVVDFDAREELAAQEPDPQPVPPVAPGLPAPVAGAQPIPSTLPSAPAPTAPAAAPGTEDEPA